MKKRNVWKIEMPFGTLASQFEKLARRLARWHAKLKNWHVWHFGTFIGMLLRKNEKLVHWHTDTSARKLPWHMVIV